MAIENVLEYLYKTVFCGTLSSPLRLLILVMLILKLRT